LGSAAILSDLVKAYERIPHSGLWREAAGSGFPVDLLKVCLRIYGGKRVVRVGRAVSEVFRAQCSIVAGCGMATTLLRAYLVRSLDMVVARHPDGMLAVFVDDVLAMAVHKEEEVGRKLASVGNDVVRTLEAELKFKVSDAKSHVVTSSNRVRKGLLMRMPRFKEKVVTKNLGVDFSLRRRSVKVWLARRKKARQKLKRIKVLRKAGGKTGKLANTGLRPALAYGAGCLGMADSRLQSMRALAVASLYPPRRADPPRWPSRRRRRSRTRPWPSTGPRLWHGFGNGSCAGCRGR